MSPALYLIWWLYYTSDPLLYNSSFLEGSFNVAEQKQNSASTWSGVKGLWLLTMFGWAMKHFTNMAECIYS
jgi:hypothetical protein